MDARASQQARAGVPCREGAIRSGVAGEARGHPGAQYGIYTPTDPCTPSGTQARRPFRRVSQCTLPVEQPAIGDAPPATLAAAIAVATASIDASQQLDAGLGSAPPADRTDATDQAEGSRRISLLKRIGSKATLPSPRRGSAGSLGTMAQMAGPSPGCLKLMAEPSSSAAQRM